MNYFLLFLCVFLFNVAALSQIPEGGVRNYEITFTDNSKFEVAEDVNPSNLPVKAESIKIYSKTVRGSLYDYGKPSFYISKNTIKAISRKNKLFASQIKRDVYLGVGIRQNGNSVRIHGLKSVKNLNQLSACVQSKKDCRVEGEAVLVQIKIKDKIENFVLLKSLKPL